MGLFSSIQNGNSFEVKKGGQISIYLSLQLLNSDKLIQCRSNLALNRKRKMTDIQIWNYRFALKMNQICFRQMEELRIKNSTFRQALSTLKDSYHDISRKIHEIQEQRKNKIILDEKKAEEESLKIKNGKYRLKSLHGNYLGGHEKHWIYTTNNTCKWEEWHIQWKEDHFQIKSFHNTFLSSTPEGKTQLEKTISTWEHWQIIPNGNQYLLRSVRGTYLSENKQKQIYLSDQPNYEKNGSQFLECLYK